MSGLRRPFSLTFTTQNGLVMVPHERVTFYVQGILMKPVRLMKTAAFCILLGIVACGITAVASAQTRTIRVVTYNIQCDVSFGTTPLAGLICPFSGTGTFTTSCGGTTTDGGALEGIGEEILAGNSQPIDILALQETTNNT